MKILFLAPYAYAGGHHETDLEFAERFREAGHTIYYIQCRAELSTCDLNPSNDRQVCALCRSTSDRSVALMDLPREQRLTLDSVKRRPPAVIPQFATIEELREYKYKGIRIGDAVAASAIIITRDTKPSMVTFRRFVEQTAQMFIATYEQMLEWIDQYQADAVYFFNGKSGALNAAFWAAKTRGLKIFCGERETFRLFNLFEDAIAVDLEYQKGQLALFREQLRRDPGGAAFGRAWFEENRTGNAELLCNFTREMILGKLPANWDPKKRNIALFQSSEDEIAAIPGWENPFGTDQRDLTEFILAKIPDPDFHFYLRAHPNLKGLDNTQTRMFDLLRAPNLTFIAPESVIDSYALLEACEKTITFSSTIGIEATFWGRPAILGGRSVYEDLDATYRARSREDIVDLLRARLTPKPRENTYAYGYWLKKRGSVSRFVTPQDPRVPGSRSMYRGVEIGPGRLDQMALRWRNRLQRLGKLLRSPETPTKKAA